MTASATKAGREIWEFAMDNTGLQLFACLRAFCRGEPAQTLGISSPRDWDRLHRLGSIHKLLPVLYETLGTWKGFCGGDGAVAAKWRQSAFQQAARQAGQTRRLLTITRALEESGVVYAVVKGAVCRAMYPKPDLRISADEDIFIPVQQRDPSREVFTRLGLRTAGGDDAVEHWRDPDTGLHIELHTALLESDWPAAQILNPWFCGALARTVRTDTEQGSLQTLEPTVHFVFLIAHALKHFITGGFGVRTACDIVQFARKYDTQICRDTVYDLLDRIHGRVFFDQLLHIGSTYLDFDPASWDLTTPADFEPLVEDMIDAGIYGQSTLDRKHGGAMALQAVRAGKKTSVRTSLFPGAAQLKGRYPILQKAPWLLPAVWVHRIGCYGLDVLRSRGKGNSPRETVSSGRYRLEMMIRYGILPQAKTEDQ